VREEVEALEHRPTGSGTSYDDSALTARVAALETKPDKDTVYDDSALKARVETLEQRPVVNTENLVTKEQLATELSGKLTSADLSGLLTKTQADNDYATKQELEEVKKLISPKEAEVFTLGEGTLKSKLKDGYELGFDLWNPNVFKIYNKSGKLFEDSTTWDDIAPLAVPGNKYGSRLANVTVTSNIRGSKNGTIAGYFNGEQSMNSQLSYMTTPTLTINFGE